MIKKVEASMDFQGREQEVLAFWREHDIFKKAMKQHEDAEPFTFYDGPPTANGKPHIGHIETRAIKDLIPRYQSMKGRHVLRKAGWDTHGLPVELEVEKALGLDGKEQIEAYGIEPFIKACKQSVWKYKADWEKMSERVGFWADMENPYITYEDNYIESVWWSLKQIADKGLLYKGHKVVPYCPRCGTALSSHEVSQGYKCVKEKSAFVRFRIKGEDNAYLYAWTTTPWTLPSNVALCVNPDETYARFMHEGKTIIMAKALIAQVLGEDARFTIVSEMPGRALVGMEYEPLFDFVKPLVDKPAWRVVADTYVTTDDGTGIVHQAPAFGEDDARVCNANNMPFLQLVDTKGCMTRETPWAGAFVKDADPLILKQLKDDGLLVKAAEFEHDYPFCWRCDTPLIYYARSTWFIKMTQLRDRLMAANQAITWYPDNIRDGRMGNFLENVIDWGLSRERYWGTPLPVWLCDCGHIHVVGSRAELEAMGEDVPHDLELHRPYIDKVALKCPSCGGQMRRTPEVIDCWYDSGSMPFAQWHYPFENKEEFERRFPADFISEAIDQTRGWFYTLIAIGTLLFDRAPFEHCVVMGHVQDKDGQKMSKHKGNVVDPWAVLDAQGADAVRWYFYASAAPWLPTRFSGELVSELQRKFMGTLLNTYAFFTLYASIDGYDPAQRANPDERSLMDKWVLSKLNELVKQVDEGLSDYKITETARAIAQFVDELSNWYVRRCRERFWGKGLAGDKLAAFDTLYTVLLTLAKLCAPYVPFMAESMYQNLMAWRPGARESVHLTDFPTADESLIDRALTDEMERVIGVVQLGRAARSTAGMKVRQSAQALYVKGAPLTGEMRKLVEEELNVKAVHFVEDARAFTTYRLKPQMRTLGPRYGKLLGQIGRALLAMDGNDVVDAFARGEQLRFELDGTEIALDEADVLTEPMQKPGFVAESDNALTVVLDTNLTPELIEEGFVREVISKLQTMRKDSDLEVVDRVKVTYEAGEKLNAIIERGCGAIMRAVLAVELTAGKPAGIVREWSVNGEPATFGIERA
ncbi:MAG: isoleucine--tRNA ligase [Christensenellaceae bacterium]|nr:isoleucine--tRNA ligase [Christensenellaceae bacterium]MEA5068865.1 isoleucine--tRNA ligase [Christensenellaceae bacterium]